LPFIELFWGKNLVDIQTESSGARTTALLVALLLLLSTWAAPVNAGAWDWATGASNLDAEGKRDWGVEVIPYLWVASLNGRIGIPPVGTIPVDVTFSDLADNLDAAFAGVMDARFRRWHVLVDGSWVRLKAQALPPQPALLLAAVTASVAFGTAGISYELPIDRRIAIELYLAARWWHVDANALIQTAGPPVAGGLTEVWADAVVGTRIRYHINDKWRIGLTADIGAGQADLDWQALGFVGYMFNPHFGLSAGYRILGVNYRRAGFLYDMRQSGLILGFNLAY
jgi:hypothetical protein